MDSSTPALRQLRELQADLQAVINGNNSLIKLLEAEPDTAKHNQLLHKNVYWAASALAARYTQAIQKLELVQGFALAQECEKLNAWFEERYMSDEPGSLSEAIKQ